MSEYLHYIGKSNKNFTHGRAYLFYGNWLRDGSPRDNSLFCISVKDNRNHSIFYPKEYKKYVEENFKYLEKEDYKRIIRKNKLNKLK
jgi:hypothetical protein